MNEMVKEQMGGDELLGLRPFETEMYREMLFTISFSYTNIKNSYKSDIN